GGGGASITPVGLLASLGAGLSYAVYALSSKALLERGWSPTATMGATFGAAAVIMLPVLLGSNLAWLGTARGISTAVWLAVITTGLAYTLFARGLSQLPASRAATLTLVEPLTATVLGVLVLHEQFTAAIVAGLVLLVIGLAVLTSGWPRPRGTGAPPLSPR
ncbi:EamA family transporter, partial [Subtercola sp. RTI3]|uniref:EamA family transporter n=1 Tax=Subtercola sp. RTI3 TaxID=3048639 RepID=UPI002B222583